MFDSLGAAIGWWIDGLADAVSRLGARLGGKKSLRIVPSGQGYAIEGPGRRRTEMRIVESAGGGVAVEPETARRALAGRSIDVALSPESALVRYLDPLPPESQQYLDGIVRHQVERLTPWLPSDVLYGYRVEPAGPGDPRLAVTVAATARSLHASIISALRAAGGKSIHLLQSDPDLPSPIAIPVDAGAGESARRARLRRVVGVSLGLASLAAVAGIAWLMFDLERVQGESAAVENSLEARRKVLLAASQNETPAEQRNLDAMIARKREAPLAVLAIDALSKALPDDTFVSELRFSEGRVRMIGTSRSVAGLVPLVEGAPAFSEAGFFAPTTRLSEGRGDRFHIDARWLPAGGPP